MQRLIAKRKNYADADSDVDDLSIPEPPQKLTKGQAAERCVLQRSQASEQLSPSATPGAHLTDRGIHQLSLNCVRQCVCCHLLASRTTCLQSGKCQVKGAVLILHDLEFMVSHVAMRVAFLLGCCHRMRHASTPNSDPVCMADRTWALRKLYVAEHV